MVVVSTTKEIGGKGQKGQSFVKRRRREEEQEKKKKKTKKKKKNHVANEAAKCQKQQRRCIAGRLETAGEDEK